MSSPAAYVFWCPTCHVAIPRPHDLSAQYFSVSRHINQYHHKTTQSALDRLTFDLEVKAVDVTQRIIEGYAAVTGNTDRVGDIITPGAFAKTLKAKKPEDVGVFLAHNTATLPLGVPLSMTEDAKGLYTRTRIFRTTQGDDLLQTALELQAVGKTLGMSIGFYVKAFSYEKSKDGPGLVRQIQEVDLVEYSYAAAQTIANPEALVTGVKQADPPLPEPEPDPEPQPDPAPPPDVEIKAGRRMRREYQQHLSQLSEILGKLRAWAEYADNDNDDETDQADKRVDESSDVTVDAYADRTEQDASQRARDELEALLASIKLPS